MIKKDDKTHILQILQENLDAIARGQEPPHRFFKIESCEYTLAPTARACVMVAKASGVFPALKKPENLYVRRKEFVPPYVGLENPTKHKFHKTTVELLYRVT